MSDVITSAVPFEHPEQTGPLDPHEINPKMASDIAYWSRGCYELCTHLDSLRGVVCC
jgi:hypothetical protein